MRRRSTWRPWRSRSVLRRRLRSRLGRQIVRHPGHQLAHQLGCAEGFLLPFAEALRAELVTLGGGTLSEVVAESGLLLEAAQRHPQRALQRDGLPGDEALG